jgi:hypothetical protein
MNLTYNISLMMVRYRSSAGLEDVLAYGNSLVIMLCGKSGTGMPVNTLLLA